jgi:hypothetical protein
MPPLSVTGIALRFLYIDDVRTSQETHVSTACYGDSFTFAYADDVCTLQETHLRASTAYYGDILTLITNLQRQMCWKAGDAPLLLSTIHGRYQRSSLQYVRCK